MLRQNTGLKPCTRGLLLLSRKQNSALPESGKDESSGHRRPAFHAGAIQRLA
jgi:hypothetical protein